MPCKDTLAAMKYTPLRCLSTVPGFRRWLWSRFPATGDPPPAYRDYVAVKAGVGDPDSVLEFGCSGGANLVTLRRRHPGIRILQGLDVSPAAVDNGNRRLALLTLPGIHLTLLEAGTWKLFRDRSFDTVFTAATLMHLDARELRGILQEFLRVARRRLVLVEPHCRAENPGSQWWYRYWVHDYLREVFCANTGDRDYRPGVETVPSDIWSPGCGYACCLTFEFKNT